MPSSNGDCLKSTKRSTMEVKQSSQPSARAITIEDLRKYFHLPIAEVARHFGTCTTALKKICRKLNITKWPYRQILSLTKSIQSLEMAVLNDAVASELRAQYRDQITNLQKAIAEVMRNPSKAMESMNLNTLSSENTDAVDGREDQDDDEFEKSDIDVQQIISAASAALSQYEKAPLKKPKLIKRKLSFCEGDVESNDDGKQVESLTRIVLNKSPSDPIQIENNTPNVFLPVSNIGLTVVQHNSFAENPKHQFIGQVILAPLQRKKFRPNTNRKVVPLMEPDIGSNIFIEIIPNMIVNMLQKSLDVENSTVSDSRTSLLVPTILQN